MTVSITQLRISCPTANSKIRQRVRNTTFLFANIPRFIQCMHILRTTVANITFISDEVSLKESFPLTRFIKGMDNISITFAIGGADSKSDVNIFYTDNINNL